MADGVKAGENLIQTGFPDEVAERHDDGKAHGIFVRSSKIGREKTPDFFRMPTCESLRRAHSVANRPAVDERDKCPQMLQPFLQRERLDVAQHHAVEHTFFHVSMFKFRELPFPVR